MMECCTDIKVNTFEFKWTIKNFLRLVENCRVESNNLKSSFFSGGNDDKTKWHLLCIVGYELGNRFDTGYSTFHFFAVCDDPGKEENLLYKTISAYIDKDGKRSSQYTKQHKVTAEREPAHIFTGFYGRIGGRKSMDITDDQLVFICRFEITSDVILPTKKCAIPKVIGINSASYLADLLANENFSDVTFVLGDEKLKAHKHILATRSAVFAAMFEHPMKEQSENEVVINDIDVDVFKKMLRYIYTNEFPSSDNMALELLYAADKYGLEGLKEMCGASIQNEITVENAAEAFMFADRHNLKSLLESILNFINTWMLDVMQTVGFKNIEKEHPELAISIVRRSLEQSSLDEKKK